MSVSCLQFLTSTGVLGLLNIHDISIVAVVNWQNSLLFRLIKVSLVQLLLLILCILMFGIPHQFTIKDDHLTMSLLYVITVITHGFIL